MFRVCGTLDSHLRRHDTFFFKLLTGFSMSDIFIIDDQHPEDLAMLQALYSRSPASVVTHLEKLKKSGSGKFMDAYYVGYGHASIGDCGTTTVFVEQVSMLVAKAIQDTPLYNGQEASTRYLDFSQQTQVNPHGSDEGAAIQARWMDIYNATLPRLVATLEEQRPFDPAQYKNERIWRNTLQARAFDIARSLLPLGTTTLLSWTTSLRQMRDNLRRLKHHPLPEVRDVARNIFAKLLEKYPHSFNGNEMNDEATPRDRYAQKFTAEDHFVTPERLLKRYAVTPTEETQLKQGDVLARRNTLDREGLRTHEADVLAQRPAGAPLPWRLESYGRYNFLFLLDFGSFRDIQRHRNGVCQIPLMDGRYGMNAWYLEQFDALLSTTEAANLKTAVTEQMERIADLPQNDPYLNQCYFPMGMNVLGHTSYSVPETAYVAALRSGKTVHPSLRPVAQKMLKILEEDFPTLPHYGDMDADDWTAKRGEQTIAGKSAA